jgi:hypothetical protein
VTTPMSNRVWVQPPPVEPYIYGLLSAAAIVNEEGHWQINGVEYFSDACAQGGYVKGSCPQPIPGPPETATLTVTTSQPANVNITVEPVSGTSTRDIRIRLDANAPAQVLAQVHKGTALVATVPVNPGNSGTYTPGPAPEGDGTYTVTVGDCTPIDVTVPYDEGSPAFGTCTVTTLPGKITAQTTGAFDLEYQVLNKTTGAVIAQGTVPVDATGEAPITAAPGYSLRIRPAGTTQAWQTADLAVPTTDTEFDYTRDSVIGTTHDKPKAEGLTLVQGSVPFSVYARAECNAMGFVPDPKPVAINRLHCIENREVEHFFSREMLGAPNPRKPLGDTAVPLKQAIGALEADAGLFYCGRPTLHAPRWTAPYFADRFQLQDVQGARTVLRTVLESRIAFGAGYYDNPFDPADPPTAGFWLVATGTVRAYRSEVFVHDAFDAGRPNPNGSTPPYTSSDLRVAIAERTYALDHDCYRAAVLVTVEGEG